VIEHLDEGPTPFGRTLSSHVVQYDISPAKRTIHGILPMQRPDVGAHGRHPRPRDNESQSGSAGSGLPRNGRKLRIGWEKEILHE